MNAGTQSHAKMADSVRTHMEAINAHANLDLREKIPKNIPLTAGLVNFRPNSKTIMMMRKMFFVL